MLALDRDLRTEGDAMTTRALVAYGSKYGSTQGIAEAIGAALRDAGLEADVAAAKGVGSVAGYDAVIVGAGVYVGRWNGDALSFVKRFSGDLSVRPVWFFSSGPTGGDEKAEQQMAEMLATQPGPPGEAAKWAERLGIRGHRWFAGRVTPDMGGIFARWIPRGDWRDFDAIAAWAGSIAEDLRQPVAVAI
jgi:menaquinone-dependent protoporphyrinogen oxidase